METLILYIIKVNLSLVIFYLLYGLLFRKDTFIKLRRYYFLSVIIFSLSYPLYTVSALVNLVHITKEPKPVTTETSVYIGEISMGEMIVEDVTDVATPIDWTIVAKNILLVGVLLLSLRFLWQLFSIVRIKSHSEKRSLFGYLFYHLKDEITPFSFFNWIFVNSETHNEKELKQILLHEHTHARQWHSVDILLVEILRIAFWWNPIVWLMKRDIAINLEYLADSAVLQKGIDTHEYQCNLLQMNYPETAVQLINNFNVSQLKQRIIMMNSKKSPLRKLAKYLIVLPLALLLITANSLYAQTNDSHQEPVKKENKVDETSKEKSKYHEVTENLDKLESIFKSEIKYPQIAQENGMQGDVIVSFVVKEDGSITNPKIIRGTDPSFNTEVMRVISTMPKLKQFTYIVDDEPLRIKYSGHFAFRLDGKKTSLVVRIGGYTVLSIADRTGDDKPLFIVDGVKMGKAFDINSLNDSDIEQKIIYQKEAAIATYGEEGMNGAVLITLKDHSKSSVSDKEDNNEIVVKGYGSMQNETLKGVNEIFGENKLLTIIDGVRKGKNFDVNSINPEEIESISVLKNETAIATYGSEAKNGVIVIVTKPSYRGKTTAPKISKDAPDEVFVVVENQPEFPGGMEALMKYLGENIRYPVEAMINKTEGRVIANFLINKDGAISDVNVVRSVDPLLDAEAVRVLSLMPNWKPGMQRGEAVNVRFTIPVVFRLKKDETVDDEAMKKLKERGPVTVYEEKNDNPDKGYLKFLGENIKYPVIAQENGIMGVSRATYDVDAKGEISNIKITESVDPSLDAELVRVTKLIPKDIALIRSGGKAFSGVEVSALFRLQDESGTSTSTVEESDVVVVGYGKPVEKK